VSVAAASDDRAILPIDISQSARCESFVESDAALPRRSDALIAGVRQNGYAMRES
jgi:hypothetical protein